MNPIESYLNELIVNIDNVKDLDKDDLINILYLIYHNKENTYPIIYNMIECEKYIKIGVVKKCIKEFF